MAGRITPTKTVGIKEAYTQYLPKKNILYQLSAKPSSMVITDRISIDLINNFMTTKIRIIS
jgi:hypothetical protein